MKLRADYSERVVVDTRTEPWTASPTGGVSRKLLDRDGDEVARATSLVHYAAGSTFPRHVHERGEEFLVLEGEFHDERGAYPAGSYVRNPWHSSHAPSSPSGCILFVKLRQILEGDAVEVTLPAVMSQCVLRDGEKMREVLLHAYASERVTLERWGARVSAPHHEHPHGEELFVLEGAFEDEHGVYPAGTWLRQPAGSSHVRTRTKGACST